MMDKAVMNAVCGWLLAKWSAWSLTA